MYNYKKYTYINLSLTIFFKVEIKRALFFVFCLFCEKNIKRKKNICFFLKFDSRFLKKKKYKIKTPDLFQKNI